MPKPPLEELDQIHDAPTDELSALLGQVAVAQLSGSKAEAKRLEKILAERLSQVLSGADLLGRLRLAKEVDAVAGERVSFAAAGPSGIFFLPRVEFREATEDLMRRDPRVAPGWRATQEAYVKKGFAAARAATENVAERIQDTVGTALKRGTSRELVERRILQALRSASPGEIAEVGLNPVGFTRAYADTVFRTLTSSSYARGRREQAKDPQIRRAVAGWRFTAVGGKGGDGDTRRNHSAADGLIAHFDDPIWSKLSPPLGYACRCALELVPTVELAQAGLSDSRGAITATRAREPSGAYADKGFVSGGGPV